MKSAGISQGEVGKARLEAVIADNLTRLGTTDVPVPQDGVLPAAVGAGSANVMQASAPSPVLEERFSDFDEQEIAFYVEKLQSVVSMLSDTMVLSMSSFEKSTMSPAAKKRVLSVVGGNLFERAVTFQRMAEQYGGKDIVMSLTSVTSSSASTTARAPLMSTGAQDLAAAGQQLHVTAERFQADVAICLRNISAAKGTQEEKKQQTKEAASVMNKTSRQIRKAFRHAEPSAHLRLIMM